MPTQPTPPTPRLRPGPAVIPTPEGDVPVRIVSVSASGRRALIRYQTGCPRTGKYVDVRREVRAAVLSQPPGAEGAPCS